MNTPASKPGATRVSPLGVQAREAQRNAMIKAQQALQAERQGYAQNHQGGQILDSAQLKGSK
jgi:hypothetical protein